MPLTNPNGTDGNISVSFIDSSEDVPDGYNDATYQIQTLTTGEGAELGERQRKRNRGYGSGR